MSWKEVTSARCTTVSTSLSGCWRISLSEFFLLYGAYFTEHLRLESYHSLAPYVFVPDLHSWLGLPCKRGHLTSMWQPGEIKVKTIFVCVRLVSHLDKDTLRLLAENERVACFSPSLRNRLTLAQDASTAKVHNPTLSQYDKSTNTLMFRSLQSTPK